MKKTLILILATITLLFTACGSKVPFSLEKPLPDSALVYVYFPQNVSTDESSHESEYNIFFNDRRIMETIYVNEYMAFNVKPEQVKISITRKQIEEKIINLNLQSGKIYYLKIVDNIAGNQFDFIRVDRRVALGEITQTGKAGTAVSSPEYIVNVFTDKEATVAPSVAVPTKSKTDELLSAAELKEKGLLSDEEFNKLKSEILAR